MKLMIQNLFLFFVMFKKKIIIEENVIIFIQKHYFHLRHYQSSGLRHFTEVTNKHTNYKMTQRVLPESKGEKCQQMKNKNIRFKLSPHYRFLVAAAP